MSRKTAQAVERIILDKFAQFFELGLRLARISRDERGTQRDVRHGSAQTRQRVQHRLPVAPAGAAPASGTADRQPEAGSAERNPKVLIVEDNEDMRNFLRINLEEQYEIYTAHDGNDGWEQIRNIYPDLVVSDVMMPGMDGFELCRRSKAELLTCHIPFLLLTAKGDEENRAEGYSAGADGYIAKPFSIKTLRTRVNSLIEQRIKLRERYRQKLLTDPSEIQIESENDKFIDTLVKAIEQNIDNSEFGIQELCEISRYSYQQVYRKVKALTGESINEFIRTVRLKRAAQYLAQSDTRISEIMYSVGFNSHSYFTKCFREHFGLSPKEYAESGDAAAGRGAGRAGRRRRRGGPFSVSSPRTGSRRMAPPAGQGRQMAET